MLRASSVQFDATLIALAVAFLLARNNLKQLKFSGTALSETPKRRELRLTHGDLRCSDFTSSE